MTTLNKRATRTEIKHRVRTKTRIATKAAQWIRAKTDVSKEKHVHNKGSSVRTTATPAKTRTVRTMIVVTITKKRALQARTRGSAMAGMRNKAISDQCTNEVTELAFRRSGSAPASDANIISTWIATESTTSASLSSCTAAIHFS